MTGFSKPRRIRMKNWFNHGKSTAMGISSNGITLGKCYAILAITIGDSPNDRFMLHWLQPLGLPATLAMTTGTSSQHFTVAAASGTVHHASLDASIPPGTGSLWLNSWHMCDMQFVLAMVVPPQVMAMHGESTVISGWGRGTPRNWTKPLK